MTALHEIGHAIVVRTATTAEIRIYLWPGFGLYPAFGKQFFWLYVLVKCKRREDLSVRAPPCETAS